ncbi:MAG: hypothetical protein F6K54_18105 [Okeania sp. SIO3B5]|uniref:hypothetical protein n=1 Tax=Okeania sp. SIO3B5 TaxID=2607811 RepID=UPI0014004BCC|nr:hypothetical protein [Okeania sp. SIO3B5]NEO54825.1 hypothetical protein [Okeania sp. SIO3B5]
MRLDIRHLFGKNTKSNQFLSINYGVADSGYDAELPDQAYFGGNKTLRVPHSWAGSIYCHAIEKLMGGWGDGEMGTYP